MLQRDAVPGLYGEVAREYVVDDARVEGVRDQCGGSDDETVERDCDAVFRQPKHQSGQKPDFEAADRRQDAERVGRVGLVQIEAAANDGDLPYQSGVVKPGPSPRDPGRVGPGHCGADCCRGARVADAHIATGDQVRAPTWPGRPPPQPHSKSTTGPV